MTCGRCEGLMVQDNLLDLDDLASGPWVQVWRCINCGAIVEDRIRVNQLAGLPGNVGAGTPGAKDRTKDAQTQWKPVRKQTASCHR